MLSNCKSALKFTAVKPVPMSSKVISCTARSETEENHFSWTDPRDSVPCAAVAAEEPACGSLRFRFLESRGVSPAQRFIQW